MYKYDVTKLDNGLRVATCNMPYMNSVSLGIWLGAGGRYENKHNAGISHFLEHLLFKGTINRKGPEIKKAIESLGGALNGFTSEEATCYLVKIPCKYTHNALDVLTDMILNPLLLEEDIEKERAIIMEEIKMHMDVPMYYVDELLTRLLWPNQPLGMDLAGTFETVGSMKRKDIEDYRKKYYTPVNTVITAVGNLSHNKLVTEVKRYYSRKPSGLKHYFSRARTKQKKEKFVCQIKDTEQSHLSIGMHTFGRKHQDINSLKLLNIILGGNMSSRLFSQVREKQALAYGISSAMKSYKDTGALVVNAGVENGKVYKATNVIIKELEKIALKKVSCSEFESAKKFYRGQLSIALEDTSEHMIWMGTQLMINHRIKTKDEVFSEIDKIEIADLHRVMSSLYSKNKLNLAVIGPLKDRQLDKIKKLLGVGNLNYHKSDRR